MKLLLIEDEPSLREVITRALQTERYLVETAADYASALEKTALYRYDCILLDLMLPDGNGLDLLRQLKTQGREECIIILSARDAVEDRVAGLELGADDYLPKPFHLSELSARIRSVTRRKQREGRPDLSLGNLNLDPGRFLVEVEGRPLELGRKEYDILHHFLTRPGRLVTKEALAEAVWGDHIDQADNYDFVYAQVKNLRRKLSEAGATVEIKAVYGFGYKILSTTEA